MMSALILINCKQSPVQTVKHQVEEIGVLDYLFEVIDTYNLALKISAVNKEKLREKVTNIINLQSIQSALSLIIL